MFTGRKSFVYANLTTGVIPLCSDARNLVCSFVKRFFIKFVQMKVAGSYAGGSGYEP